ncbi:aspartate kinase [bacterium]|nr:aspartate kinase [bacterium]
MRKTLVLKFGGASLKDIEHFENVVSIIKEQSKKYHRICVVVSAIAGMTDYLDSLAASIDGSAPSREKDMLLSVGERVSMSLLAMLLQKEGLDGVSLTGSQAGIITTNEHLDARIVDVRPIRLVELLDKGKIPIIAGFQGVSLEKEVTTLGRGGSDTSAVALAVALDAEKVVFYKDVRGVFSKDPKKCKDANLCEALTYERALDVIGEGGRAVLHPRSVELARKNNLVMHVRSFVKKWREEKGSLVFCNKVRKKSAEKQYEEEALKGGQSLV